MNIEVLYKNRFLKKSQVMEKNKIWQILCKYFFQKFVPQNSTLVDIGAGNCEFINNIKAKNKIALDFNPGSINFVDKNSVKFFNINFFEMEKVLDEKADIIFCSNILEHLNNKNEVMSAFDIFNKSLKVGGKLFILQPNIKYVKGEYWDFIDHNVPLTDKSIIELGKMYKFKLNYCCPKFLPYSTISRFPKFGWLVFLYLKLMPISGLMFGKQSFLILEKIDE